NRPIRAGGGLAGPAGRAKLGRTAQLRARSATCVRVRCSGSRILLVRRPGWIRHPDRTRRLGTRGIRAARRGVLDCAEAYRSDAILARALPALIFRGSEGDACRRLPPTNLLTGERESVLWWSYGVCRSRQ